MEILVYIAYDGDDIGGHVERAALTDDEHGLTMLSEGIRRANVVMNSFAVEHGGRVVSMGGDEGVIAVPASALSELEPLREMYFECAGATVSMGVGRRLSEASKALMVAKVRGKDQIAMYDPEVDGELEQVLQGDDDAVEHEHAQDRISDEEEAPPEEGQETDAHFKAEPDPGAPTLKQRIKDAIRRSSGAEQKAEGDEEAPPQEGEEAPPQEGGDEPQSPEELQQIVAGALEAMKGQQQALEALSQQAPEVYQAVVSTVQAMIDMAHYALGDQAPEAEAPEGEEAPPQEGEAPAEEEPEEEAPSEKAEGPAKSASWHVVFPSVDDSEEAGLGSFKQTLRGDRKHIGRLKFEHLGVEGGENEGHGDDPDWDPESEGTNYHHPIKITGPKESVDHVRQASKDGDHVTVKKAEDEYWKPGDMAVLQGKHRVKVKAWNGKPGSDVLVEHPRYKGDVAVEYRHLTRPPDFKKAGLPLPENTNKRPAQNLPVGSTRRGEKKVQNPLTGEKKWTSVQTGQVKGPSGAAPAGKPKFIDVAGNPVDKQGKPKA